MSDRDDALSDLFAARSDVAAAGLRRFSVTFTSRTWSGPVRGSGTSTDVDFAVLPAPVVRTIRESVVASSGGKYLTGDYEISKITPLSVAGGTSATRLTWVSTADNVEMLVKLVDDEGLSECSIISSNTDKAFEYVLVVRARVRP